MWQSIKAEYWSARGVAVTFLHMVTLMCGLLVYMGWHEVWYGLPAFKMSSYSQGPTPKN